MTRFSTDQLTTFATVIEYGTFDAAADILRVSPSAISQRIKAMEQIAGKSWYAEATPSPPPTPDKAYCASPDRANSCSKKWNANSWAPGGFQSVSVAVNADSLATWFLDAVGTLSRETASSATYDEKANSTPPPCSDPEKSWQSSPPKPEKNPPAAPSKPSAWHATGALPPLTTYSGTCPAGPRP